MEVLRKHHKEDPLCFRFSPIYHHWGATAQFPFGNWDKSHSSTITLLCTHCFTDIKKNSNGPSSSHIFQFDGSILCYITGSKPGLELRFQTSAFQGCWDWKPIFFKTFVGYNNSYITIWEKIHFHICLLIPSSMSCHYGRDSIIWWSLLWKCILMLYIRTSSKIKIKKNLIFSWCSLPAGTES